MSSSTKPKVQTPPSTNIAPSKDRPLTVAPAIEEAVTFALNEQGYLFQQRVLEELSAIKDFAWQPAAMEFPVSLGSPGTYESRIDAVLKHTSNGPWHLLLECKRAHPDYKQWVFFDDVNRISPSETNSVFIQRAELSGAGWDHTGLPPLIKRTSILPAPEDCPVFNFYLETRIERPGSGRRASATEVIEASFRQLGVGLVGLSQLLHQQKLSNFSLLPVVVTSAEVFAAHFDPRSVSLSHGHIETKDLVLKNRDWVAVNYRIDESVSRFAEMTGGLGTTLREALMYRYLRTVFVVRADKLTKFLTWFDTALANSS